MLRVKQKRRRGSALNWAEFASVDQTAGHTHAHTLKKQTHTASHATVHPHPWLISCPLCIFLPNLWLVVARAFIMKNKRGRAERVGWGEERWGGGAGGDFCTAGLISRDKGEFGDELCCAGTSTHQIKACDSNLNDTGRHPAHPLRPPAAKKYGTDERGVNSAMGQIKNIRKNKNTLFLALRVCIRSKLQLHCQTSWISYPDFTGGVRMAGKPWSEYETSVVWGAYLVRTALWFWLSHQGPVPEWTWNWESEEQRANSLETFHACLQIFSDKLFSPRQLLPLIMLGYHWLVSFRCTGANVTRWC